MTHQEGGEEIKPRARRSSGDSTDDEDGGGSANIGSNQFAFIERATQTLNNAMTSAEIQTEPPPR